jgi:hypothetical protein
MSLLQLPNSIESIHFRHIKIFVYSKYIEKDDVCICLLSRASVVVVFNIILYPHPP